MEKRIYINLPGISAEVKADAEGTVDTLDWFGRHCSAEDGHKMLK